ncbi:MAG: hypothetical protein J6X62_06130 [Bacteroidales bacterium]|nr:hypothetical protein [Bacteroidales bacterium]
MDAVAYTNNTDTAQMPHTRRIHKASTRHAEISKTPESELMSVDEYFDMVWNRYMEKYEKLHR